MHLQDFHAFVLFEQFKELVRALVGNFVFRHVQVHQRGVFVRQQRPEMHDAFVSDGALFQNDRVENEPGVAEHLLADELGVRRSELEVVRHV